MPGEVTQLLRRWGDGDHGAFDRLVPLVYNELRRLARSHMRRERSASTFEPTGLVHEAYMRLVDRPTGNWKNRRQFYAVASQVIRRVLVDHARARGRQKRRAEVPPCEVVPAVTWPSERSLEILRLDAALDELAELDATQVRIVELRFYTGLTIQETAEVLDLSPATVKRAWSSARAWLAHSLATDTDSANASPS